MSDQESLFRVTFEEANTGMALVDSSGRVLDSNRALRDWLGTSAADRSFVEDIFAEHALFAELMQGTRSRYQVEKRHVRPGGDVVWGRVTAAAIRPSPGDPVRVLITVEDITEQKRLEHDLARTAFNLGERVKELQCLYSVVKLVDQPSLALDAVCQGVVDLIPPAWQRPDLTCARLVATDREYRTANFRETAWKMTAGLTAHGEQTGVLEVCLLAEPPTRDASPFLKEEQWLLDSMAGLLGGVFERRKREIAEQALKESERKLLIAQRIAHVGYWEVGDTSGPVAWSDETYRILGLHPGEIQVDLESLAEEYVHPRYRDVFTQAISDAMQGIRPYDLEYQIVRPDGTVRTVHSRGEVQRDADGTLVRMYGAVVDITERKQAEQELRNALKKLQSATDAARVGIWWLDIATGHLDLNDQLLEFYGISRDEFLPDIKAWRTRIYPADRQRFEHVLTRLLEGHRISNLETRVILSDGEIRCVSVSGGPVYNDEGQLVALIGTNIDVTRTRQNEETMRLRANRLEVLHRIYQSILANESPETVGKVIQQSLVDLVPFERVSIALLNEDQSEWRVLFGQSPQGNLEGQHFPASPGVVDVLRRGEIYRIEDLRTRPDFGVVGQNLVNEGIRSNLCAPLLIDGRLIGSLNVGSVKPDAFSDDHKEIIREMGDSLAIAVQQARQREEIQRGAANLRLLTARLAQAEENTRQQLRRELHDHVGQNLAVIGINLAIAQAQLPETAPAQTLDYLNHAAELVEQTTAIIRDVMIDLSPPVLDDYGLLAALRWYGKQFAERTGVAVNVLGEALKPRLEPQCEIGLFRIAQEALTNVAKHAQAKQVTVKFDAQPALVRLTIVDDGVGFVPASPAEPKSHQSWGLLTMAERADNLGGQCRVESQPGQGTQIIVEVPR